MTSSASSQDPQIDVYWRPGCPFCMNLERQLSKLNVPYQKHNIWENPADSAYVRSVADGNEVVPTVRVGGIALVNPSGQQVLTAVQTEFPGFLPDSAPSKTGLRNVLRRR